MLDQSDSDGDVPTWGLEESTAASPTWNNDAARSGKMHSSGKEKEFEARAHDTEDLSHERKLEREVEALVANNTALQSALTEALNQISSLEGQLEESQSKQSSSTELANALDKISTLEGKLAAKELMEDTMMMDNSASQAALDDALKKVSELEKKLSRSQSAATMDNSAARTALQEAQSKISELEESLSQAVFLADSTRTQKEGVVQERDALERQVEALSQDKSGLSIEVATLQQDLAALKEQTAAATAVSQSLVVAQQKLQPQCDARAGGSARDARKRFPVKAPPARRGGRLGAPSRELRGHGERKPAVPKFPIRKLDLVHVGQGEKHRKPRRHGPHYLTTTNETELRYEGRVHIAPHMRTTVDHTSAPAHSLQSAPKATHDFAFLRHLDHGGEDAVVDTVEPPKKGAQPKRKPLSWTYKGTMASAKRYNETARARGGMTKGPTVSNKRPLPFLGSPSRRRIRSPSSTQQPPAPRYRSRSVPDTRGRELATRRTQAPKPTRPRRRRADVDLMVMNAGPAAVDDSSQEEDQVKGGGGSDGEMDDSDEDTSPSWAVTSTEKKAKKHMPLPPSANTSQLDDSQLSASSVLAAQRGNKAALLHAGVPLNSSQDDIVYGIARKRVTRRAVSLSRSPSRVRPKSHATMGTPSRLTLTHYRSSSASPQRAINGLLTYRPPFQRPFVAKPACTFGSGR